MQFSAHGGSVQETLNQDISMEYLNTLDTTPSSITPDEGSYYWHGGNTPTITPGVGSYIIHNGLFYIKYFAHIEVRDMEMNFLYEIGDPGIEGSDNGHFNNPETMEYGNLAVDSQDRLWVGDGGNNRIQIFDTRNNLDYVATIPIDGNNGNFIGLSYSSYYDMMFVAETVGSKIEYYDMQFNQVASFGATDPHTVSVNPQNGHIAVGNGAFGYIEVFNLDGTLIQQVSSGWYRPIFVAHDREGRLFICDDAAAARFELFDLNYQYLESINTYSPRNLAIYHDSVYVFNGDNHFMIFKHVEGYTEPTGLEMIAQHNIYTRGDLSVDYGNVYVSQGYPDGFGYDHIGVINFDFNSFTLDQEGNIYLANNYGLRKYDPNMNYIGETPTNDPYAGGLNLNGMQLLEYHNGYIYLADSGNKRILVYEPVGLTVVDNIDLSSYPSDPYTIRYSSQENIFWIAFYNDVARAFDLSFNDINRNLTSPNLHTITIAPNGYKLLGNGVEGGNASAWVYDDADNFVTEIYSGTEVGFNRPVIVATDEYNRFYICSDMQGGGQHRIQVFDSNFSFIMELGEPNNPGSDWWLMDGPFDLYAQNNQLYVNNQWRNALDKYQLYIPPAGMKFEHFNARVDFTYQTSYFGEYVETITHNPTTLFSYLPHENVIRPSDLTSGSFVPENLGTDIPAFDIRSMDYFNGRFYAVANNDMSGSQIVIFEIVDDLINNVSIQTITTAYNRISIAVDERFIYLSEDSGEIHVYSYENDDLNYLLTFDNPEWVIGHLAIDIFGDYLYVQNGDFLYIYKVLLPDLPKWLPPVPPGPVPEFLLAGDFNTNGYMGLTVVDDQGTLLVTDNVVRTTVYEYSTNDFSYNTQWTYDTDTNALSYIGNGNVALTGSGSNDVRIFNYWPNHEMFALYTTNLVNALGIDYDPESNTYWLAETFNDGTEGRIHHMKLNQEGTALVDISSFGTGLDEVYGVAVTDNLIFVPGRNPVNGDNVIRIFSYIGEFQFDFVDNSRFVRNGGIDIYDDRLYYLEQTNRKIYVYDLKTGGQGNPFVQNSLLYMPLNDIKNMNVEDLASGYTGFVEGDPVVVNEAGRTGIRFSGEDYINIPGFDMNLHTFTLNMWVKPDAADNQQRVIIDFDHHGAGGNWALQSVGYNDYALVPFGDHRNTHLTDNNWQMFTITVHNGQLTQYINGQQVNYWDTDMGLNYFTPRNLTIGALSTDTFGIPRFFQGILSEMQIIDFQLSSNQVMELYTGIPAPQRKAPKTLNNIADYGGMQSRISLAWTGTHFVGTDIIDSSASGRVIFYDSEMNFVNSFEVPFESFGVTYDNVRNVLWIAAMGDQRIHVFSTDPNNFNELQSISIGVPPEGLSFDPSLPDTLWIASEFSQKVFRYHITDNAGTLGLEYWSELNTGQAVKGVEYYAGFLYAFVNENAIYVYELMADNTFNFYKELTHSNLYNAQDACIVDDRLYVAHWDSRLTIYDILFEGGSPIGELPKSFINYQNYGLNGASGVTVNSDGNLIITSNPNDGYLYFSNRHDYNPTGQFWVGDNPMGLSYMGPNTIVVASGDHIRLIDYQSHDQLNSYSTGISCLAGVDIDNSDGSLWLTSYCDEKIYHGWFNDEPGNPHIDIDWDLHVDMTNTWGVAEYNGYIFVIGGSKDEGDIGTIKVYDNQGNYQFEYRSGLLNDWQGIDVFDDTLYVFGWGTLKVFTLSYDDPTDHYLDVQWTSPTSGDTIGGTYTLRWEVDTTINADINFQIRYAVSQRFYDLWNGVNEYSFTVDTNDMCYYAECSLTLRISAWADGYTDLHEIYLSVDNSDMSPPASTDDPGETSEESATGPPAPPIPTPGFELPLGILSIFMMTTLVQVRRKVNIKSK
ncbi:MAG: hypothetical protein INQ03_22605 [Candidatus Heimdallarchaeota archaeon]|nr:hypothetical protein [Candidatus Heimdallarchaeota archaeon]